MGKDVLCEIRIDGSSIPFMEWGIGGSRIAAGRRYFIVGDECPPLLVHPSDGRGYNI